MGVYDVSRLYHPHGPVDASELRRLSFLFDQSTIEQVRGAAWSREVILYGKEEAGLFQEAAGIAAAGFAAHGFGVATGWPERRRRFGTGCSRTSRERLV